MPRPTASNVRRAVADRYGRSDLTDDQVSAILADPELTKLLGLDSGVLSTIGDLTKSAGRTAADFGIGAAKGLADTITAGTAAAPLIDRMRQMSFGGPPMDFTPGEDFLKQFEATNPTQMTGKGLELAAEMLAPTSVPRRIGAGVSSVLAKRSASRTAKASAADAAKAAARTKALSIPSGNLRIAGKAPTVERGLGDILEGARGAVDLPATSSLRPPIDITDMGKLGPDVVTSGRPGVSLERYDELLKPPPLERVLQEALEDVRMLPSVPRLAAAPSGRAARDLVERRVSTGQPPPGVSDRRFDELLGKFGGRSQTAELLDRVAPTVPGPATTAAERVVDSALPLSARISSPTMFEPLAEGLPGMARGTSGRFAKIESGVRDAAGKLKTIRVGGHEIDLSIFPGGRPSPEDFKDILQGRGKALAAAKGREIPFDELTQLDRLGIEYRDLKKGFETISANPGASPDALAAGKDQMRRAGAHLMNRWRSIFAEAAKDERGAINPAVNLLMGRLSAVAAGGATGYVVGDDDEARLGNAALGMFVGAFATTALPDVAKALMVSQGKGKAVADVATKYMYPAMLSRPASILRAWMGATSGVAHGILIRTLEGDTAGATKMIKAFQGSGRRFIGALQHGPATQRVLGSGTRTTGVLGLPLRLISAADDVGVHILQQGGFSLDDAKRLTLAGVPQTPAGQGFVQWAQTHFIGQLVAPFARVSVNVLEQPFTPFLRSDLRTSERLARGAITLGAGTAANALGGNIDPRLEIYITNGLSGPNALPVALNLAAAWAREQDKSSVGGAISRAVWEQAPISLGPGGPLQDILSTRDEVPIPGTRFVPGLLSDIGRVLDPKARETRDQPYGPIRKRLPGTSRQSLPERDIPLDIFGGDLPFQQPPENPFARLFVSDPIASDLPTRFPKDSPAAQELLRLGIEMQPPRGTVTRGGVELPVPKDIQRQVVQIKGEVMEDVLEAVIQTPGYQQLSSDERILLIKRLRERVSDRMERPLRRVLLGAAAEELTNQ